MEDHSGWTLLKGEARLLLREGLLEQPNLGRQPELIFYIILTRKSQKGGKGRQYTQSLSELPKQNS